MKATPAAVKSPGFLGDGRAAATAAPPVGMAGQRWWRLTLPVAIACADVAAVALALTVVAHLSYGAAPTVVRVGDYTISHDLAGLLAVPAWSLILAVHGAYAPSVVGTVAEESRRVLRAGVAFFAVIAVVDLVWTTNLSSRLVVVVAVVFTLLTLLVRFVGARVVHHAREQHRWMRRAVVYGGGPEAGELMTLMAGAPHLGVEVVGTCTTDAAPERGLPPTAGNGQRPPSDDVQADDQLLQVLSSTGADMLAVTAGTPADRLRSLAWHLEGTGVEVLVAPAVTEVARHAVAVRSVGDLLLLRVEECRLASVWLVVKNVIDCVGASLLLVLLSPVMIAAAIAVRLTSPGPVLYHQTRVGQHGRVFSFLKFRTMVRDADALLPGLSDRNESDGLLFKIHDDPRVTAVGRVLRRYSIDELPQLLNVVVGDMSLVGPRPLPVSPDAFTGDARRRLRVKPGITGLWQVSGRSELSWDDAVRLDMDYVDRWSLALDLKILLRTPAAVVRARGAY
jgi:exopolysaccharide biosynthesis polyprenyl glycosylphosphotransferase